MRCWAWPSDRSRAPLVIGRREERAYQIDSVDSASLAVGPSQEVVMTADLDTSIRASRVRVPRSRGAASGVLLLALGAWAALVPFIGPYLNVAFTPRPNSAWHWTADRGWFHVLPGALTVLGGLLLL